MSLWILTVIPTNLPAVDTTHFQLRYIWSVGGNRLSTYPPVMQAHDKLKIGMFEYSTKGDFGIDSAVDIPFGSKLALGITSTNNSHPFTLPSPAVFVGLAKPPSYWWPSPGNSGVELTATNGFVFTIIVYVTPPEITTAILYTVDPEMVVKGPGN